MPSKDSSVKLALAFFLALNLALLVYGVIYSDLLTSHWTPTTGPQIRIYWLCSTVLFIAAYFASIYSIVRFRTIAVCCFITLAAIIAGPSASAAIATVTVSSFLIGAFIWSFSTDKRSPSASILIAVGLAIFSIGLSISARFPINSGLFFQCAAILPLALLLSPRVRVLCHRWAEDTYCRALTRSDLPAALTRTTDLGLCVLLGTLGVHFLFALMPERYYDALSIHLYIPSYVLAHGRWPFNASTWVFAHMPLGVDFLYTMLFALGGEGATKLFNFIVLALMSTVLLNTFSLFFGSSISVWTTVLFVSTPLTFIETASLFIENTLTLWILAATAILAQQWSRITFVHATAVLILLVASVMAKLHGVVAAALIGSCLVIAFAAGRPSARSLGALAGMAMAAAGLASWPYFWAWFDTGNPVFPFFNAVFRSSLWPSVNFTNSLFEGRFHWSLLWDTTFHSSQYLEAFDGALGLGLFLFLPVGLLASFLSRKVSDALALFVGLGFILIIASQTQYLRYFFPTLPVLFFLVGRGIEWISDVHIGRLLLVPAVTTTVVCNLYLIPTAGWILGNTDFRAAYDQNIWRQLEVAQAPERIINKTINELAGRSARVLYTGNSFGALLQGTALASNWYNTKYFAEITNAQTPEHVQRLIEKLDINFVVHTVSETTPYQIAAGAYLKYAAREVTTIGGLKLYELLR